MAGMSVEQALSIVNSILVKVPLVYEDNNNMRVAMDTLKAAVTPSVPAATPAVVKKKDKK